MVAKVNKPVKKIAAKKPHKPAVPPAPTVAPPAPTQNIGDELKTVAGLAIGSIFSQLLGKVIPNYSAGPLNAELASRAGLRNGMSADAVNAAIHEVVTRDRGG